jgi:hypothetical protein
LESTECEQQYFGQFLVIFATVLPDASPTQNKATVIKIANFQGLVTVDWT